MTEHSSEVESFYDEYGERLGLSGDYEQLEPVLPPVDGRRVLDAGCGLGDGAQYLAENGATVVGIDISQSHVDRASERHGESVTFHRADLSEPLDMFDAGSFDVVVCALTLAHVEDWESVFREFARVLQDDGTVVVHLHHPFVDYLELIVIIVSRYRRDRTTACDRTGKQSQ